MVRENPIVVMGAHDDRPDYDYADGAEVRIYALQEGQEASAVVYDMDQNADMTVTAKNTGGRNFKLYSISFIWFCKVKSQYM